MVHWQDGLEFGRSQNSKITHLIPSKNFISCPKHFANDTTGKAREFAEEVRLESTVCIDSGA
jgi:hypothetical protein